MEDILKKPLFWVVAVLTLFNIGVFVIGKVVVDKAADRVIEKLQKEYSPSPYGPGLDPDRVNVDAINNQRLYFELTKARRYGSTEGLTTHDQNPLQRQVIQVDNWRSDWEKDRGFPEN